MMRPAVRLCLGVVTNAVVIHVAPTPILIGNISRCVFSIGAILRQYFAFQPR
jgi:hypothetical protein